MLSHIHSFAYTTMWTILGFQLCSVAVPLWIKGGHQLPSLLVADGSENAPLCDMALKLKKQCIPIGRGSGRNYLNLAAVLNQQNNGIMQKILPLEDNVLSRAERYLAAWRENGFSTNQVQELYTWLDEAILTFYKKEFGF